MKQRKQYSGAFKAKVVLEVLKDEKTVTQIASEYGVHPTLIHGWKREFLEKVPGLFEDKRKRSPEKEGTDTNQLYQQIGQLKVENDFLKDACAKLNLKPGRGLSK